MLAEEEREEERESEREKAKAKKRSCVKCGQRRFRRRSGEILCPSRTLKITKALRIIPMVGKERHLYNILI